MKNWIMQLDLSSSEKDILDNILLKIENNLNLYPHVMTGMTALLYDFKIKCKNENDTLMREALGDACNILSQKKLPSYKDMSTMYCHRIKKAIFPKGITEFHHTGEKNFYKRMKWEKEE